MTEEKNEKLDNFSTIFQGHVSTMNLRISHKVSLINRRLDALARLLEGNQICVAIRYSPAHQALMISSNAISQVSRPSNQYIKNIYDTMALLANHHVSMSEVIEELARIIKRNLLQEKRFELKSSRDTIFPKVKAQLINLYKSGKKTKDWEKDAGRLTNEDRIIIERTARLARDFMKLRKSIYRLTHATGEDAAILKAMRDKQIQLIKTGGKDEHAEIRQISSIEGGPQKPYLGLSKLCCARCALTVNVMNISTRGHHGRLFNNWGFPGFFQSDHAALTKFLGPAAPYYDALSVEEKKIAEELIMDGKKLSEVKEIKSSMLPDTSSSDEAFGLSEESADPDELDLSALLDVMNIKEQKPETFRCLRGYGNSIRNIADYSRTPEKLAILSSKAAERLIKEFECAQVDLEDLYDEDRELLDYVLADRHNLIEKEGFDEAVNRYRDALEKKRALESELEDDDYLDFDVDADVSNTFLEENGWDYDENEEDSENQFGYRSDCSYSP